MVLLSPPCPGALLQGTCPKDYKEVSKGAGAHLVLEHAGGLQALGPNVVPKGLQTVFCFFFLVFYVPFRPLPEGRRAYVPPSERWHQGSRVFKVCLTLHLPGLG